MKGHGSEAAFRNFNVVTSMKLQQNAVFPSATHPNIARIRYCFTLTNE
jgi:hypothetical protein